MPRRCTTRPSFWREPEAPEPAPPRPTTAELKAWWLNYADLTDFQKEQLEPEARALLHDWREYLESSLLYGTAKRPPHA